MNLGKLRTESERGNIKEVRKNGRRDRSRRPRVNHRKGVRKAEAEDNSGEAIDGSKIIKPFSELR